MLCLSPSSKSVDRFRGVLDRPTACGVGLDLAPRCGWFSDGIKQTERLARSHGLKLRRGIAAGQVECENEVPAMSIRPPSDGHRHLCQLQKARSRPRTRCAMPARPATLRPFYDRAPPPLPCRRYLAWLAAPSSGVVALPPAPSLSRSLPLSGPPAHPLFRRDSAPSPLPCGRYLAWRAAPRSGVVSFPPAPALTWSLPPSGPSAPPALRHLAWSLPLSGPCAPLRSSYVEPFPGRAPPTPPALRPLRPGAAARGRPAKCSPAPEVSARTQAVASGSLAQT
jgi:hypothetical protein